MSGGRGASDPGRSRGRRRLLVAQLVGKTVETGGGRRMGRVVDLELVVEAGGVRIAALELGTSGLFDRLHLMRPLAQRVKAGREPTLVPWEDVERVDDRRLIVRRRS